MSNFKLNHAYNMDCMAGMAEFPDGYFDLAVVDPPYGGAGKDFKRSDRSRFGGHFDRYKPLAGGGNLLAEPAASGPQSMAKK